MNQRALQQIWDQQRQKYGIYLRLLEAFPEEKLHTHPVPGLRSPAEMVAHVSGTLVRDIAQGVAKGEITAHEASESAVAAGLAGKADLLAFARRCWEEANAAVAAIGDAELAATVPTPWGMTLPGFVAMHVLGDEFVHHRGQLYAYARLCGVAPPFVWSFAENAPEFRPAG